MMEFIGILPDMLRWKILSFLPIKVLKDLKPTNKGAWMIFNSGRIKSEEWNDQVNWMQKLLHCRLTVSKKLFMLTLADLQNHMKTGFSHCPYFKIPTRTTFELLPLQDVEISLSFRGFVLKGLSCPEVPWDSYKKIPKKDCPAIPKSSPVYDFMEREFAYDQHIQMHFDSWRENYSTEPETDHLDDNMAWHMEECEDCEYVSGGSEYAPDDETDLTTDVTELDEASLDQSNGHEIPLDELIGLRDDYEQMVKESEKSRCAEHRAKVEQWMEESLQKWERGDVSSDEYEYNPFSNSVYSRKRRYNRKPPNEEMRKRYCPDFNNSGLCHRGKNCWFRHEKSPMCKDDLQCKTVKCGFYHSPKPVKKFVQQLQEMDENIAKLKEGNLVKEEEVDKADFHETDPDKETVEFAEIFQDDDHNEEVLLESVPSIEYYDESQDVDECRRQKEELSWVEFLRNHQKPRNQFWIDMEQDKKHEHWRMRSIYIKNHGPFLHDWVDEIPEDTKFSLFFMLSEHPIDMKNVNVRNKRELQNLIVWDVHEENRFKSGTTFLGLAVLFRDKYLRMHQSNFKHYVFGVEEMMAYGIVGMFTYPSETEFKSSLSPFFRSYPGLKHYPSYFEKSAGSLSDDGGQSSGYDGYFS